MQVRQRFFARFFRILPIVGLLVCAGASVSVVGAVGDSASEKSKDTPNSGEQTPEQAAGGFRNLLRMRKACEAEAKRFCPDVKPGGGRILQCLHQHEADLSSGCREAMGPRPAKP